MRSSRRSQVPSFAVMDVLAQVERRRHDGADIINLCVGEPAGGAAAVVREAAVVAVREKTLGYSPAVGLPALREAIAAHYLRWYATVVDPARVVVTTGSSGAFVLAFLTAFDVGDRVAVTRPGYPAYVHTLRALGCEVVEIPVEESTGYQLDVALLEAAGPLDGVILASPANPTGAVVAPSRLAQIGSWCAAKAVTLISDEIYHGITYADTAPTTTAVGMPAAVVVSSFSKYWAMTGWRVGWMVLPDGAEPTASVAALASNLTLCPPVPAQHAALEALTDLGYADGLRRVETYAQSREVLLAAVESWGWRHTPADGAFYLYLDISGEKIASEIWCQRLLAEAEVALTPGWDFDAVDGGQWVRASFCVPVAQMSAAVERISRWKATSQPQ